MDKTRNAKVKLVRVITRLNIGGPAIHTILLTKGLNDAMFESYLVTGVSDPSEGDMSCLAQERRIPVHTISELRRDVGVWDIAALWKLFVFFIRTKPDIVHTHTAKAGALGRVAAFLAGVPIRIHTFHGHIFDGYFNPRKAGIFLAIERLLARITDKVIVVSEKVKDEIVDNLKVTTADKCMVVRLGLELGSFLHAETLKGKFKKELELDGQDFLVGIVGRLVPIKNHRMFLDAALAIKNIRPNSKIKFIIIGDGELKDVLKADVVRLNLSGDVIFTGWANDLVAAYADLDIVTLISLNEGTPLSLIEAMASARAVVATDVGGVADVVINGETGFLVKSGDIDGFAKKVIELMDDPVRRESFGRRGREFAVNNYSKDRLVNDMRIIYEQYFPKLNKRRKEHCGQ